MLKIFRSGAMITLLALTLHVSGSPLETPCGGTVGHGHATTELTTDQKEAIIAMETIACPLAIRLAGPTSSYNCHSFAFTGGHGWLPDPAVYIDSYEVDWGGDCLTYFSCITDDPSHSAILSSSSGLAISKWGLGSLMQHMPNYVPIGYGMYQGVYKRTDECTSNYDCQ